MSAVFEIAKTKSVEINSYAKFDGRKIMV